MKRLYAFVLSGVVGLVGLSSLAESPFGVASRVEADGKTTFARCVRHSHQPRPSMPKRSLSSLVKTETPVGFTLPASEVIQDKFSKKEKPVFKQSFEAVYALDEKVAGQNLTVHFQGCDEANCYFPEDRRSPFRPTGGRPIGQRDNEGKFRCRCRSTEWRAATAGLAGQSGQRLHE